MSLIGRVVDRVGQARRDYQGPWGHLDGRIPGPGEESGVHAGVVVTDATALRLMAVWACVSLITDVVGCLPVGAFRRQGPARQPVEPSPSLLNDPHPEMDPEDWISRLVISMLMRGNLYGLVTDVDRNAIPTTVLPVHPDEVRVYRKLGPEGRRSGRITYRTPDGEEGAYPSSGRMLHVRGLTLPGSIVGLDPIAHARQAIGLGLATEEFGARFFGDGAHPSGFLTTEGKISDEAKAKRMVRSFEKAYGGRSRRPALLTDGVEWKAMSINPDEAQFLETRRFQVNEIARLYRVPPHLIGDVERSTSWGTGIEQQGIGFVTYTLGPWIRRLERGLTKLLPRGQYVRFNVAGLLRGDIKARYQAYALGRQWGWLSVNDILALEDRPPIGPDGDVYLQPLNMIEAGTQITRDDEREQRRSALLAELAQIERDVTGTLDPYEQYPDDDDLEVSRNGQAH